MYNCSRRLDRRTSKPSWRATRWSSLELDRAISCEMRTLFRSCSGAVFFNVLKRSQRAGNVERIRRTRRKKRGEPRVGEKTVAPATHVVYVLTNLTGLKETVKKKKQKKREKKPHRTNL